MSGSQRGWRHIAALDDVEYEHVPDDAAEAERHTSVPEAEGNVVTSEVDGCPGTHLPVLDIDFEARLVPSKTPGHYHLYLDHLVEWEDYEPLLVALANAGIIEQGYMRASLHRRATYVRKPPCP